MNILSNSIKFTRNRTKAQIRFRHSTWWRWRFIFVITALVWYELAWSRLWSIWTAWEQWNLAEGNGIGLATNGDCRAVSVWKGVDYRTARKGLWGDHLLSRRNDLPGYKNRTGQPLWLKLALSEIWQHRLKGRTRRQAAYQLAVKEINEAGIDGKQIQLLDSWHRSQSDLTNRGGSFSSSLNRSMWIPMGSTLPPHEISCSAVSADKDALSQYPADRGWYLGTMFSAYRLAPSSKWKMLTYLFKKYGSKCYIAAVLDYNYGILSAEWWNALCPNWGRERGCWYQDISMKNDGFYISHWSYSRYRPMFWFSMCVYPNQDRFISNGIHSRLNYIQRNHTGRRRVPIECWTESASPENMYVMASFIEELKPQKRSSML